VIFKKRAKNTTKVVFEGILGRATFDSSRYSQEPLTLNLSYSPI